MELEHHIANLGELHMHNAHVCYLQEKWPIVCIARERSISATEQFQRKSYKFYCLLSTWQCFHDEQKSQR